MERRYSKVYWKIYDAVAQYHPSVISNRGGARSTKTFSTLQFLNDLVRTCDTAGDITSVVSETLPHLKKGAIRDFERIIGVPLKYDRHWNESDHCYTYDNGGRLEFFSTDSPDKVQGPARKRLFVNEANHITYETYRQLAIRTTGLKMMDYNPTSSFWAMEKVECLPTTITINSTYKDNPFLSPEQVREIESNMGDERWWRVYGLGLVGTLEGTIFDFEQVDTMPERGDMVETYGIDFGFTNDPTAVVRCLIDTGRKAVYYDEILFAKGLLNSEIITALEQNEVPKRGSVLYADCAEPKSIEELYRAGYNAQPCYKATRKAEQLQMMRGYKIFLTKRSVNIVREARGYVWAQDKNGNMLNEPIAYNDHAMDACRYALVSHLVQYAGNTFRIGYGSMYD